MYPFFKVQKNVVKQSSLTLLLVLAYPQSVYSHSSIYPPNSATWDHPSWPIYNSRSSYVCPALDPNNAYDSAGNHSHIFDSREFGYCFYKHYITPSQNESGPVASTNNNGQSGDCPNNLTSNPVNIATGNKFFSRQDFIGQGVHPLALTFSYNSNSNYEIWTVSYTQKIIPAINEVAAKRPDGRILIFDINNGVASGQSQSPESLILLDDEYKLTLVDGTVEDYDIYGQLLSITYPNGIVHTVTRSLYNDFVYIRRQNESRSIRLTVTDGKVMQATFFNNHKIQYEYDTSINGTIDRLTKVTYPDNLTRIYHYENPVFPTHITGITDENGNRISSVQYDTLGRAISSEVGELNSGIERSQIEYHEDGSRTVTNALGKKNTYHFTQFNGEYKMTQVEGHASDNCASANQAYTYDANGFMASKTDWKGNVTTYIHNDRGLETSRTEASGTPEARTITTEWHTAFNLRTKITEPERETVLSYDENGRLTSQEVNPR